MILSSSCALVERFRVMGDPDRGRDRSIDCRRELGGEPVIEKGVEASSSVSDVLEDPGGLGGNMREMPFFIMPVAEEAEEVETVRWVAAGDVLRPARIRRPSAPHGIRQEKLVWRFPGLSLRRGFSLIRGFWWKSQGRGRGVGGGGGQSCNCLD